MVSQGQNPWPDYFRIGSAAVAQTMNYWSAYMQGCYFLSTMLCKATTNIVEALASAYLPAVEERASGLNGVQASLKEQRLEQLASMIRDLEEGISFTPGLTLEQQIRLCERARYNLQVGAWA